MAIHLNTLALIPFFLVLLAGCGSEREYRLLLPKDESTAEERQEIARVLSEISDFTEEFGDRHEYNNMKIVVVTEDFQKRDRVGYCIYGRGFIALNRILFNRYQNELFTTILHELGHCYYRRGHDDKIFTKEDSYFNLRDGVRVPQLKTFAASVMHTNAARIKTPKHKSYYVGELLGYHRASSYSEIENYHKSL